jgi:hypothetical protein
VFRFALTLRGSHPFGADTDMPRLHCYPGTAPPQNDEKALTPDQGGSLARLYHTKPDERGLMCGVVPRLTLDMRLDAIPPLIVDLLRWDPAVPEQLARLRDGANAEAVALLGGGAAGVAAYRAKAREAAQKYGLPLPAARPLPAPSAKWACPVCTFENEGDAEVCAVSAATAPAEAGWKCQLCTLINKSSAKVCESGCPGGGGGGGGPRPAARAVSPPKPGEWACSFCTLFNPPHQAACVACNGPRK